MIYLNIININQLVVQIDELLSAVKSKDQEEFRPLGSLKIMACFLFIFKVDDFRKTAECVGLPDLPEDLQRCRVTSSLFSKVCQKVLDKMHGGLVTGPLLDLSGSLVWWPAQTDMLWVLSGGHSFGSYF